MNDTVVFEPANCVHDSSRPETHWSRVNCAESIPGVMKPLVWAFIKQGVEIGNRGVGVDMGVPEPEHWIPEHASDCLFGSFYGRFSINIDQLRGMMAAIPGFSSKDHERDFLGSVTESLHDLAQDHSNERMAKAATWAAGIRDVVTRQCNEILVWWQQQVRPETIADLQGAPGRYRDALARYTQIMRDHSTNSTLAQQHYAQLSNLADSLGKKAIMTRLAAGYGDTEDTRAINELWSVSRSQMTIETFLESHGFQTSAGDDMSAMSWRENPRIVLSLAQTYTGMDDAMSPHATEAACTREREAAQADILSALPAEKHEAALRLFSELESFTKVREMGKASYRRCIDAGRAACRAWGTALVEKGALRDPEDVFFLTEAEAFGRLPDNVAELIAERRSTHDRYRSLDIPVKWQGNPIPILAEAEGPASDGPVIGIGVSPGVVEGTARVVVNQDDAEPMEPGDILVTHTTDPSWGPFILVASAMVIDIGGAMSHGAIIAREIGVPCVINTRDGTRRIKDGDILRVDGSSGEVAFLRRADQ